MHVGQRCHAPDDSTSYDDYEDLVLAPGSILPYSWRAPSARVKSLIRLSVEVGHVNWLSGTVNVDGVGTFQHRLRMASDTTTGLLLTITVSTVASIYHLITLRGCVEIRSIIPLPLRASILPPKRSSSGTACADIPEYVVADAGVMSSTYRHTGASLLVSNQHQEL